MTTNLLDDLKNVFKFDNLEKVDTNKLHALIRWLSFEPLNLGGCMKLNKYFFYMDKKVMLYALHFEVYKHKRFIQYMKKQKVEDKLLFLKERLQKYYNWSDRELKQNWQVMEMILQDKANILEFDKKFGFNEQECKILNIDYVKPKLKKLEIETTHKIDEWF